MTGTNDRSTVTPAPDAEPLLTHQYDWAAVDPSTAVVETLAAATDRDPVEADPLYQAIDPDALNALFTPGAGEPTPDLRVTFRYQDVLVTVSASGTVSLTSLDDD